MTQITLMVEKCICRGCFYHAFIKEVIIRGVGWKIKARVKIWMKRAFEENNFEKSSITIYYCNQTVS